MRTSTLIAAVSLFFCSVAACQKLSPPPASGVAESTAANDDAGKRSEMIRDIEADVRATRRYTGKHRLDPRVMAVLGRVPRHQFVPAAVRDRAYENRPLSIGERQTISQPYIVALMTDLLELEPGYVVLEVGTGSGYQAAVLAELVSQVYTIEIVEPLGRIAAERFERLGYGNITTRIGDGYAGWPEHAPFDAIIVTAAAKEIPPPLIEQLKPGGKLVLPVASGPSEEQLTVVTKSASGELETKEILPVRFVPLTRDD